MTTGRPLSRSHASLVITATDLDVFASALQLSCWSVGAGIIVEYHSLRDADVLRTSAVRYLAYVLEGDRLGSF